jgi:hypothetical protein
MIEERRTYYSYLHDATITERRYNAQPSKNAEKFDELNLAEKFGYIGSFLGMSVVFLIHPVIGIIVTGISITTLIAGSIYRNF